MDLFLVSMLTLIISILITFVVYLTKDSLDQTVTDATTVALSVMLVFLIDKLRKKQIEREEKRADILRGRWAEEEEKKTKPFKRMKRKFTEEEVSKHTELNDLWLIIDGKVYDFSKYWEVHPGGKAIFKNAGKDSSLGFHGNA